MEMSDFGKSAQQDGNSLNCSLVFSTGLESRQSFKNAPQPWKQWWFFSNESLKIRTMYYYTTTYY